MCLSSALVQAFPFSCNSKLVQECHVRSTAGDWCVRSHWDWLSHRKYADWHNDSTLSHWQYVDTTTVRWLAHRQYADWHIDSMLTDTSTVCWLRGCRKFQLQLLLWAASSSGKMTPPARRWNLLLTVSSMTEGVLWMMDVGSGGLSCRHCHCCQPSQSVLPAKWIFYFFSGGQERER